MNVPWNIYEAAILLNGYLQIKYAERNRDEVIAEVSEKLRTMAINNGLGIDEKYRNKNGISMQMTSLESAYKGYNVGIPSTHLFEEIVKIYFTDLNYYNRLLEEAHRMIDPMSKKDAFELWVKDNTHYTKNDLATFYRYYDSIEAFAHKRKAILGSIFDINQREINNIEAKVFNNPLFRIGRNVQAYRAAFEVLISFLKDYRSTPTNLAANINTNETIRSEIKNPQTTDRKSEVKQQSSSMSISPSKADDLKQPSVPKSSDENANGETEETAPNAGKTIQEIIDDVNRRAERNRVFLNFFDDLKNEYPEFEFTNINAKGVERKNKVYIYCKDAPRQGNVLFELKHIKEKNDFVLLIKREYLTEEEFKEAIDSSNKSTNARGRLTRHWKNCQDAVDFIAPKLKLAAIRKRTSNDNKTANAEGKTPVVLSDTILDYFEPISKHYPELAFTNLASTGLLQRRCVYIYPKNIDRRGNVVFEFWITGKEYSFVLFAKRQFLSDKENKWIDSNPHKSSTKTRGRLELSFKYREEIVDYFTKKLDLVQESLKCDNHSSAQNETLSLLNQPEYKLVRDSLERTIDYLKSRYAVRLHYDNFADPDKRTNDLLYKVNNGNKDIIWVYMRQNRISNFISIETEPFYLETADDYEIGFFKTQTRNMHPQLKLFFDDYDAIASSLEKICNSIDLYFDESNSTSLENVKKSFEQTVDFLKSEEVFSSKNTLVLRDFSHNKDFGSLFYGLSEKVWFLKDVLWVYVEQKDNSYYINLETEPEYLQHVKDYEKGFYDIQTRSTHPRLKMSYDSFESVKESLKKICESINKFINDSIARSLIDPNFNYFDLQNLSSKEGLENCKIFQLYFPNIDSLSNTEPYAFIFNNAVENRHNVEISLIDSKLGSNEWSKLYTELLKKIYENNVGVLSDTIDSLKTDSNELLLVSENLSGSLKAPKQIADNVYAETDLTPNEIAIRLKRIIDFCGIPYSRIAITYKKPTDLIVPHQYSNKILSEFSLWLSNNYQYSDSECLNSVLELEASDVFLKMYDLGCIITEDKATNASATKSLIKYAKENQVDDNKNPEGFSMTFYAGTLEKYLEFLNAEEKIHTQPPTPKKTEPGVLDLQSFNYDDLVNTVPQMISYKGAYFSSNNWKELYVLFLSFLNRQKRYAFIRDLDTPMTKSGEVLLYSNKNRGSIKEPEDIGFGVFVETDCSAYQICERIAIIIQACEIDYSDVKIKYKKEFKKVERPSSQEKVSSEENENIKAILKKHYKFGFKYESIREIMRFRQFAEEDNIALPDDDEELKRIILASGSLIDGKVYCKSDDLAQELQAAVDEAISTGAHVIYYESFMSKNSELMDTYAISSEDILKEYLQKHITGFFFAKRFMANGEKTTEREGVSAEIKRVWGDQQKESVDNISNRLPFIPLDNIWRVFIGNDSFVAVSDGEYLLLDRFIISEDEIEGIINFVEKACKDNGFCPLNEIPLGDIEENNFELPSFVIFNAIYKIALSDKYKLKNKLLLRNNAKIDATILLKQQLIFKENCSFEEAESIIVDITGSTNRQITFQALYDEMVRVDKNNYVANRYVDFNISEIDNVLSGFITDHFTSIKNITTFAMFPACGQSWNHYLLESFCYKYSRKYSLHTIHFNDKNAGIIAERDFNKNYYEMLSIVAAKTDIELTTESVGEYLFNTGYMAKSKHSKLEEVAERAKELRK